MLEAAQLGLWDWDVDAGLVVWDDRSLAMFGRTRETMPGTLADLDAVIHPDDLADVGSALEQARQTAGSVDVEYRVVWLDGSVHWLNGRGQALVDDTGRVKRMLGTNADVTAQRSAALQQVDDARRMAGLVAVAQALGGAGSEDDVLQVVVDLGVALVGAEAAALCVTDVAEGQVQAWTVGVDEQVQVQVAHLPADFPLPMVDAAVTGTTHFLCDRAAASGIFPGGQALFELSDVQGMAAVPLEAQGRVLGSLSVGWAAPRSWREQDRALLLALATLTAQALERIWARRNERRLSETLQRTLLTSPPQPDDLQIAVRYQPAAQQAQVGGDWHDAFIAPGGLVTLVVGDVAGHDQDAAAAMAQVRNVLRGVAQTLGEPPAAVLSGLDRALQALAVPALATAVLCQVVPDAASTGHGDGVDAVRLRWSNAGHPPPLLVRPDGRARVLHSPPDLLLGLRSTTPRADHDAALPAGSTLVLYTDGLVERRRELLDEGIERLRTTVQEHAALPVEELASRLLHLLAADAEDDVALLVLRVGTDHAGHAGRDVEAGAA